MGIQKVIRYVWDMSDKSSSQAMPDNTVLRTITEIGRFRPRTFYPEHRTKAASADAEQQFAFNIEGMRTLQFKNAKLTRTITSVSNDIQFLQAAIDRHVAYIGQIQKDHDDQVAMMNQQIANRKAQIAKIDNSQDPPTMNQIFALVRQIQVEGMSAKRRAENCLRDQDINLVLSGERLRRFHEYLSPKVTDTILQSNPKLRKSYDRMELAVYRTAEMQTQLRSLRIYSSNLERKVIELNSTFEALQFDKSDAQMGIVDKREELHAELTKRSEELGKLRWKIEYLRTLKAKMNEPHFDPRE
jgi:hypothetical protein